MKKILSILNGLTLLTSSITSLSAWCKINNNNKLNNYFRHNEQEIQFIKNH